MKEENEFAVEVRGLVVAYGSYVVLNGLDMSVPCGTIFGLLGASGCGKTTLLHCILGQLKPFSGDIKVLGKSPGFPGHEVPGKDVGYMPQEIGLYKDFSMSETLYYFGLLHGMKVKDVRTRRKFLQDFLDLPPSHRLIRTLSGGQQRRVSLAVAMLQEPPLMILDEPTVGVDPILRAKIWEHLLQMASSNHTTIVITTHYIEEATQATKVGMMRDGRLLAEGPPSSLVKSYKLNSLEEVFLELCRRQDIKIESKFSETQTGDDPSDEKSLLLQNTSTATEKLGMIPETFLKRVLGMASNIPNVKCFKQPLSILPNPINITALYWKSMMKIFRNPLLLMYQILIPSLILVLLILTMGRNLKGIKLSYTNDDKGLPSGLPLSYFCSNTDFDNGLVNVPNLGELYVSKLLEDDTFVMKEYEDVEDAIHQVRKGNARAAIYLEENFTVDFLERLCSLDPPACYGSSEPVSITRDIVNSSNVHMYADITDFRLDDVVKNHTEVDYKLFLMQLIQSCTNLLHLNASVLSPLVKIVQPPIYGEGDISFVDFVVPGQIISMCFTFSIQLTSMALIVERNEGFIERSWVAGINSAELIVSHLLANLLTLIVRTILLLVISIYLFQIYFANDSEIWVFFALCLAQGLAGMACGLFLSSICTTEAGAMQGVLTMFILGNLVFSGSLWPLEAMPTWLRYISYTFPLTAAAQASKAIMGRGWGLAHAVVVKGFLFSIAWFFIFIITGGSLFTFF